MDGRARHEGNGRSDVGMVVGWGMGGRGEERGGGGGEVKVEVVLAYKTHLYDHGFRHSGWKPHSRPLVLHDDVEISPPREEAEH